MLRKPKFKDCPYCLMQCITEMARASHSDEPLKHYRIAYEYLLCAIDAYRNCYQSADYEEWVSCNGENLMKCKALGLNRFPLGAYSLMYDIQTVMRERVNQFA